MENKIESRKTGFYMHPYLLPDSLSFHRITHAILQQI